MYDPAHFYFQLTGPEGQPDGQVAEFEALMAAMQVVCASTIYGFVT
jgi:hypothetical protein